MGRGRSRVAATRISAGAFDVFVLSSGVDCHCSFKDGRTGIREYLQGAESDLTWPQAFARS